MNTKKRFSKIMAMVLTGLLVFSIAPVTALADTLNSCTHTHDAVCGYTEGIACDHYCNYDCESLMDKLADQITDFFSSSAQEAVTITIEDDGDGSPMPLYLTQGVPVTDSDLLEGASAVDENGGPVTVSVKNDGGLNRANPQPNGEPWNPQPYYITYEAGGVTATREAYVVIGFVPTDAGFATTLADTLNGYTPGAASAAGSIVTVTGIIDTPTSEIWVRAGVTLDIATGGSITVQNQTYTNGMNISGTLTLSGGTLTAKNNGSTGNNRGIAITSATAAFNMTGGTLNLQNSGDNDSCYGLYTRGSMTVTGGTVNIENTGLGSRGIFVYDGTLNLNGGTVNVKNGINGNTGIYCFADSSFASTINFAGSVISIENSIANSSGISLTSGCTAAMTGGNITIKNSASTGISFQTAMTISGGEIIVQNTGGQGISLNNTLTVSNGGKLTVANTGGVLVGNPNGNLTLGGGIIDVKNTQGKGIYSNAAGAQMNVTGGTLNVENTNGTGVNIHGFTMSGGVMTIKNSGDGAGFAGVAGEVTYTLSGGTVLIQNTGGTPGIWVMDGPGSPNWKNTLNITGGDIIIANTGTGPGIWVGGGQNIAVLNLSGTAKLAYVSAAANAISKSQGAEPLTLPSAANTFYGTAFTVKNGATPIANPTVSTTGNGWTNSINSVTVGGTPYYILPSNQSGNITISDPSGTPTKTQTLAALITAQAPPVIWDNGGKTLMVDIVGSISIAGATVNLAVNDYTYDNTAKQPGVTSVVLGGTTLTPATDYDVSWSNNINAGVNTASVSITGRGNYSGMVSRTFTINKKDISINSVSALTKNFDGAATAAAGTVVFSNEVAGQALALGTDYTVSAVFTGSDFNVGTGKPYTYTVTMLSTTKANNYNLATNTASRSDGVINKAATGLTATPPAAFTIIQSDMTAKTFNLDNIVLSQTNHGARSYTLGAFTAGGGITVTNLLGGTRGETLTYTGSGQSGGSATQVITITTANYANITVTLTFTATAKATVTFNVAPPTTGLTYGETPGDPAVSNISVGVIGDYTVTYLYEGNLADGTPGTVYSNAAKPTQAGTYTVKATLDNATHVGAVTSASFTIAKANQTALTITDPGAKTFGDVPFQLTTGTTGSGTGAVTYTLVSGPGSIAGNTLTITGAGTIVVTATKAADTNYNAITSAQLSITVNRANQAALTVNAVAAKTFGDAPFQLGTTGGSGTGTVSYNVVSGPGSISGNTLTITGAGTIIVTATRDADTNYNAVTSAQLSIIVNKANQTAPSISGGNINKVYGDAAFSIASLVSGGESTGAYSYTSSNTNVATINAAGLVTLGTGAIAIGTTNITVKRLGNANYNDSADSAAITLTVGKANQAAPTVTYTRSGVWNSGGVTVTITSPTTGATYSIDDGTYNTTNPIVFGNNLQTAIIYVKLDATATHNQSPAAELHLDFAKQDQPAPSAFALITANVNDTTYTVTIPPTTGAEYSFDGVNWSDVANANVKTGCLPDETITGYKRMKETTTHNESPFTSASVTLPLFQVKTPTATPNGGTFTASQSVTLSCGTAGADIYYTTNGSAPTTGSTQYSGVITLSATTTLKAIAVKAGMADSEVLSVTFTKESGNTGGSTGGGGDDGGDDDTVINIRAIPGVTAPALGTTPVTAITDTEQYTGTVTWSPEVSGTFAASTVYTATITLTPKAGYTLTGVAKNFFTVAGAASVTHSANSGIITTVFPATGSENIIIDGKDSQGEIKGKINLIEETIFIDSDFNAVLYCTNGDAAENKQKWVKGWFDFNKPADVKKWNTLFDKGFTLLLADTADATGKKPAADATIVKFDTIKARPNGNVDKLLLYYPEDKDGICFLAVKNANTFAGPGYEYAASANGKTPDNNWEPLQEDSFTMKEKEKKKTTYLVRKAASKVSGDTPAGKPFKVTPANLTAAPKYKVDYKTEAIQLKAGDTWRIGDAGNFEEVKKTEVKKPANDTQGGGVLDISQVLTEKTKGIFIKKAATGKKPASAVQKLSFAENTLAERKGDFDQDEAKAAGFQLKDGKLTLTTDGKKLYEIFDNTNSDETKWKWGSIPKLAKGEVNEFEIRLKADSIKLDSKTGKVISGNAASRNGTLYINVDSTGKVEDFWIENL